MKLIGSLALLAACHFPKANTMPDSPEQFSAQFAGNTPVVIRNATTHPICRLSLDAYLKYKGDVLQGFHIAQIPPGGQTTLKLAPDKYVSIEVSTCDGHSGTLASVQIDRAMEIALVKGKNHVNGPTSIEMGLDDFSQFRSSTPEPTNANCKSAGDTSALSGSECCSGSITAYSAKHPGPSHCSFSDE